jgi:lysophospholipase L1-like esterase
MRSRRPWLANLALVAVSVLVGLILIELALRLLGWSYPVFARPDADLGWSFRPGLRGWSTHENTAYVRINRYGFRGDDWPEQPAADTLRIAVLGDSYTDSTNLAEDQSLTGMIQTQLSACPSLAGRRVEVLNFGMAGYSTTQEYLQLQHRVASFHPTMVLLAYYAGNDVPDNIRPLSILEAKPYFVMQPSGELQYDGSFRDSGTFRQEVKGEWLRRLVNASYLLQAVKQAYLGKAIMPSPIKSQVFKSTGAEPVPGPQYAPLFAPPGDENWRTAWTVTEKLLLRMRDWSQTHAIDFRLVIIPEPVEALPGDAMRRAVVETYRLADLDYPVNRIVNFATQNGISHLSLLEPLRAFGDREHQFAYGFNANKPGDGHLNAVGNEVSGRAIATWLCPSAATGTK